MSSNVGCLVLFCPCSHLSLYKFVPVLICLAMICPCHQIFLCPFTHALKCLVLIWINSLKYHGIVVCYINVPWKKVGYPFLEFKFVPIREQFHVQTTADLWSCWSYSQSAFWCLDFDTFVWHLIICHMFAFPVFLTQNLASSKVLNSLHSFQLEPTFGCKCKLQGNSCYLINKSSKLNDHSAPLPSTSIWY